LAKLQSSTENIGINAGLRNFDTSVGRDLVASNEILYAVCYRGRDTAAFNTGGDWNTSPTNNVTIITPYLTSQVGQSQRSDTWGNSYYLDVTGTAVLVDYGIAHATIDGLQFLCNLAGDYGISFTLDGGIYTVQNSLFKGGINVNGNIGILAGGLGTTSVTVINCVFKYFGPGSGSDRAAVYTTNQGTPQFEVYNCVSDSSNFSFIRVVGTMVTTNCITQHSGQGFSGTTGDYNISNLTSDAPGDSSYQATVVFNDIASMDYSIDSNDVYAIDRGVDLSSEGFAIDVVNKTRPQGARWDRGAHESSASSATPNLRRQRRAIWW